MKVKLKEAESFKPITLEITIESEEELLDLYARCSAGPDVINGDNGDKQANHNSCTELFDALDQYKDQFNL